MTDISLPYAKEHLEDLIARARQGEVVTIDDGRGRVQLTVPVPGDMAAARVTDTLPQFVPLKHPRTPGRIAGQFPEPPPDFFEPLDEKELAFWSGDAG
jgi:antitoxin (DNA-binding transcriptional repressor) of toxin-antitoxin stability system